MAAACFAGARAGPFEAVCAGRDMAKSAIIVVRYKVVLRILVIPLTPI